MWATIGDEYLRGDWLQNSIFNCGVQIIFMEQ